MQTIQTRTQKLIGSSAVEKLARASIIVFGLGGVGSFVVEALARAGVATLGIVDNDTINVTNINRQLIALHSTLGKKKTDVEAERLYDINPTINVIKYDMFYNGETADGIDLSAYGYVVDAIDTVASKLLIIERAQALHIPVISSMGTGNKLNPASFEIADIYSTSVCPLARVMRTELKKRGVQKLKVLYSREEPTLKSREPASISFVPGSAGLLIASEVIKDIIGEKK
ncbi:MAG: tRNA threonylcarbamoyladenosine dehydratase [Clostridia bacterium]|nr:tRNA threonylcarbamoyladenosine dehydratase [Clostridia bacterium]